MLSKISKRHIIATALALVGCYGALLTSEPTHEPEPLAAAPLEAVAITAVMPPPAAALRSVVSARLADVEAQPAQAPKQEPAPATTTEPALADWMLAAIRGEEWDRERTHKVEAELSATLEKAPELHAQELECGKRFCRALLVDRSGADVQLQPLFGAPPFDGEGFSTPGQGGQAEIYFVRAGESLEALRLEARL